MPASRREVLEASIALAVRAALGGGVAVAVSACGGGGGGAATPPTGSTAAPSGLTYTTPVMAHTGAPIANLTPSVNGTVSSYSVSPPLPAGLAINATTGVISGTPTAAAAQATYTITASNAGGNATFDLSLTVLSALTIASVSTATPTALTPVTLAMQGLDPTQPFSVKLSNGSNVNLAMQTVRTASDGSAIVIAAPLYMDPNAGTTTGLTASVSVTQGNQTSNSVQLTIADIPGVASYGVQPGDISRAFLNQLALGLALNVNALQAVAALPSAKTDTTTVRSHLQQQQLAALEARDNIDLLLSGSQPSLAVGTTSGGQPIQFNSNSIDAMDRVLAMYLQYLRYVPSSIYAPLSGVPATPTIKSHVRRALRGTVHVPLLQIRRRSSEARTTSSALPVAAGGGSPLKTVISGLGTMGGVLVITNSAVAVAAGLPKTTQDAVDQFIAIGQGVAQFAVIAGTLAAAPEVVGAGVIVGTLYGVAAIANDAYKWYTSSQAIDSAVNAGDPTALAEAQQQLSTARDNFALDTIGTLLGPLGFPSELAGDVGLGADVVNALKANETTVQGLGIQGLSLLTGATSLLVGTNATLAELDKQAVEKSDGDIPAGTDPFGIIDGAVSIDNTVNPYLLPLDGIQLIDPATGNTFQMSAGTDNNYQMIVPLGVPGMDYSQMQLEPYDPVSDETLGAPITVDLSGLAAGNAAGEPTVSGVCSDIDAGDPDEDDPDCD